MRWPQIVGALVICAVPAVALAQGVETLSGGAGWVGTGLLGAVLSVVFIRLLPAQAAQLEKLMAAKDAQITAMVKDYNAQMSTTVDRFAAELRAIQAGFAAELVAHRADFRATLELVIDRSAANAEVVTAVFREDMSKFFGRLKKDQADDMRRLVDQILAEHRGGGSHG